MTPTPDVFFITGGTLRSDAPCYVARRADRELYDGLSRGEFCYVLTARQMGKSSLMVRTAKRLRDGAACVAVLDLTAVGQNLTAEQWYDGLLGRLAEQLDQESALEGFWLANARLGPLERFMRALTDVALPACRGPLVVFVDEIDAVRSLPFSTDEFFAAVRECYNRRTSDPALRRLTFCLLGVASPSDLIRDTRTTPFNIGLRVELDDFTESEAEVLAQGLNRKPDTATTLLRRVLHWTRGHPYLTQRLCRSVAEDASAVGPYEVDKMCKQLFLSPRARERDDNLLFVRERILRSEVDRAALLDLYGRVRVGRRVADEETNPLVGVLRLSGVARAVDGRLQVRNPIYGRVFDADWVRTNMPDAEVRRQRRAFRGGLLRASAVAAVIMAVMAGLGWYAFQKDADWRITAAKLDVSNKTSADLQKARDDAERARDVAEKAEAKQKRLEAESRRLAVRYRVATGMQMAGKGDLSGALVWFADAMDLEQSLPEREALHRLRVESALGQCPGVVRLWAHDGPVADAEFSADGARVVSAGADKTARVWDARTGDCVAVLRHDKPVTHAALSPDGKLALTVCKDGNAAWLWDVGRAEVAQKWEHAGRVTCAVFDRKGDLAATSSEDGTARVWNVETGKPATPPLRHIAAAGALSPVMGEAKDKGPRTEEKGAAIRSIAFDPECKRVVTAGDDRTAQIWDIAEDVKAAHCRIAVNRPVAQALFSPDGRYVVTAAGPNAPDNPAPPAGSPTLPADPTAAPPPPNFDFLNRAGAAQVWYADTGASASNELGHDARVTRIAFDPFSRWVATASEDRTSQIWRRPPRDPAADPQPPEMMEPNEDWSSGAGGLGAPGPGVAPTMKHTGAVLDVEFSPDGRFIVTASADDTARVWNTHAGDAAAPPLYHGGRVTAASFDPEGRRVLTASEDGLVRLWDLLPYPQVTRPYLGVWSPLQAMFSASGTRAAVVDSDGVTWLADLEAASGMAGAESSKPRLSPNRGFEDSAPATRVLDRAEPSPLSPASGTLNAWLSPDGRRLITVSGRNRLQIWDAATGRSTAGPVSAGTVSFAVFSPDGRRLLTTDQVRGATLWDADDCRRVADLPSNGYVVAAAFGPDNRTFALSANGKVEIYDADHAAKGPVRTLTDPDAPNLDPTAFNYSGAAAFSPDGRRLAVCSMSGARLWDLDDDKPGRVLQHRDEVVAATFSPDGRRVVTCSRDTTARIWDVETGAETCDALQHDDGVSCAAFSADGRRVATGSYDGTVRVWEADAGLLLTPPLRHLGGVWAVAFTADDRLATATDRQQVQVWDLAPARRAPRDDLMASVQLLSGEHLFARQDHLTPLDAASFRTLWEGVGDHSGPIAPRLAADSRSESATIGDAAWQLRQAAAAEDDEEWEIALWRLERLRKDGETPRLWARTANDLMKLNRLDEAEKALRRAESLPEPADPAARAPGLRWQRAQLRLSAADAAAHRVNWKDDANWTKARDDALRDYQKVQDLVGELPPDHLLTGNLLSGLVNSYHDLGTQMTAAGRTDGVDPCYRRCWDMLRTLSGDHPNIASLKQTLAAAYLDLAKARMPPAEYDDKGRPKPPPAPGAPDAAARDRALAAARDTFLRGLDVNESIAGDDANRPDVLSQQYALIRGAADADRDIAHDSQPVAPEPAEDALRRYEHALQVADRRAKIQTERDNARLDAAVAVDSMYRLYLDLGMNDKAEEYCRMNVERSDAWLKESPTLPSARSTAALTKSYLADILVSRTDDKGAIPLYDRSRELWEGLVAERGTEDDKANLAGVCESLAQAELNVGDRKAFRSHAARNEQILEDLVKADLSNDKHRQRLIAAYESRAQAALDEGQTEEARDCRRKVLDQREQALASAPNADASRSVADACNALIDLDLQVADYPAALRHAARLVEAQKKRNEIPGNLQLELPADIRQDVAAAYFRLGEVALQAGRLTQAREAFQNHLKLQEKAPRGTPQAVVWQSDLAPAYQRLAETAMRQGDGAEAVRMARRAVAGWQEPTNGQLGLPDDVFLAAGQLADLADAYRTLGAAQRAAGDVQAARQSLTSARGIHESLVDASPFDALWPVGEVRDLEELGLTAMQAKDYAAAAGFFRQGLAKALLLQPDDALTDRRDREMPSRLRGDLLYCGHAQEALPDLLVNGPGALERPREQTVALLLRRAEALSHGGAAVDALASAEALRGLAPNDARNLFDTARCYALMARAAGGRGEKTDTWVRKGMDALTQAVAHGFRDTAALCSEPDLDAFRGENDFTRLVDSLEKTPASPPR